MYSSEEKRTNITTNFDPKERVYTDRSTKTIDNPFYHKSQEFKRAGKKNRYEYFPYQNLENLVKKMS